MSRAIKLLLPFLTPIRNLLRHVCDCRCFSKWQSTSYRRKPVSISLVPCGGMDKDCALKQAIGLMTRVVWIPDHAPPPLQVYGGGAVRDDVLLLAFCNINNNTMNTDKEKAS